MNLQGNSGHVDGYGKHAVHARRRSSALWDSACRPDASRRRASLEETSGRPEMSPVFSRNGASWASRSFLVDAMQKTRRGAEGEKTAEDRGTELRYNILAPAKRPSRDITTAMRTVLPAAHARDSIASCIWPTAGGDDDGKADRRRKKRSG